MNEGLPDRWEVDGLRDRVAVVVEADGRYLPACLAWDRIAARLVVMADGDEAALQSMRTRGRVAMFRALERGASAREAQAFAQMMLGIPTVLPVRFPGRGAWPFFFEQKGK